MALTEIPIELSSTPSIVDGGNATAITIDSSENVTLAGNILHAGSLTLDVAGTISLDADDAGEIRLKDGGTQYGVLKIDSNRLKIQSIISDADMLFAGNDNGSEITALSLDMSDAGAATLNNGLTLTDGNLVVANGHGIDFSAHAHGGGKTSELLNDYEEGTVNLAVTTTGGDATVDKAVGCVYVKIGDLVHVHGYSTELNISDAGSGAAILTGLPFTTFSGGTTNAVAVFTHTTAFGNNVHNGYCDPNNTRIVPMVDSQPTTASLAAGQNKYIIVSVTYRSA